MKASDIVTQLKVLLPQLTDKFTNSVEIVSITRNATLMTAQCDGEHGMSPGQAVAITNTDVLIPILTFTRVATIGILTLNGIDHDLVNNAKTVTISGATGADVNFNGTFAIINVDSRRVIRVTMPDSGSTSLVNGVGQLHEGYSVFNDYNGTVKVESVPTPTSFTFAHSVTALPDPTNKPGLIMIAETSPRISSGIDISRIVDTYTEQKENDYWAFVVLGDVDASQSRKIESDATDNQQKGSDEFRQQIVEPFSVFIFAPCSNEIAARETRDQISDLFRPLLRSLLYSRLSTGLHADKLNSVQFAGHGTHLYTKSFYVHEFSFIQVAIIHDEDTVGEDLNVAFRDIDFTQFLDFGTQVNFMQGTPDLDDFPE